MDLQIDNTNDLVFTNGDLVVLDGVDAIVQQIGIRLRYIKGEWFINPSEGMPYYDSILGQKAPNLAAVVALFRRVILDTPGVVAVSGLTVQYDPNERTLTVNFDATADTGEVLTFSDFIVGAQIT
jgi:hypothetical protein